jgi:hypothetical protein
VDSERLRAGVSRAGDRLRAAISSRRGGFVGACGRSPKRESEHRACGRGAKAYAAAMIKPACHVGPSNPIRSSIDDASTILPRR